MLWLMAAEVGSEITVLLQQLSDGRTDASGRLLEALYEELRALARHLMAKEPPGRTLQATALVHEAYLRLLGESGFANRRHFMNAAAQVMRRILIDHARARATAKRGGAAHRQPLESIDCPVLEEYSIDRMEDLDRALRALEASQPRAHEVVMNRYFNGLTNEQTAEVVGASLATVKNDWSFARAWLKSTLACQ